ncbi:hypothetical protein Tco_1445740, partial [Tanacetum coccineum]
MQNLKDISNLTTVLDMALKLMAKAFQLNNSTPTNNNQRSSSNPCNSQIAQSGNLVARNAVQNQGIQNIRNQNGLSVISGIANQHRNGNIAQKEQAGIQLTYEEFDFVAAASACEETKRANANCNLENNLQQASTSEEQYTELLEPIPEPHQVQQNDRKVISTVSSVEHGGGTVEQHSATIEETHYYSEDQYDVSIKKIRRICACTYQRPHRNKAQYAISEETQYAVFKIYYVNNLEDIKRGPYSKKSTIR